MKTSIVYKSPLWPLRVIIILFILLPFAIFIHDPLAYFGVFLAFLAISMSSLRIDAGGVHIRKLEPDERYFVSLKKHKMTYRSGSVLIKYNLFFIGVVNLTLYTATDGWFIILAPNKLIRALEQFTLNQKVD